MRPLNEQVVVITGASSGIGRETALYFARRGASVVAAARNAEALESLVTEIRQLGAKGEAVVTDVADWSQVQHLAERAVESFGRIDTWINNAAIEEYARFEDVTVEEIEQTIRVNLLGSIYGMKAALPHVKKESGTIINVGSVESERAVPLQAAYVAAKQGLRGFTDVVRMELRHERSPVTVTLILPSSIDTPLFTHARSKLGGVNARPIPPVYHPRAVAEAIAFAATNRRREIVVGGAGKLMTIAGRLAPELTDRYMVATMFRQQRSERPAAGEDNMFEASRGEQAATGAFGGQRPFPRSLYTRHIEQYPNRKRAILTALGIGVAAGIAGLARRSRRV